jgi:hypothetical protein
VISCTKNQDVHSHLTSQNTFCFSKLLTNLLPVSATRFGFVIFWQKDFGAKAAHKMLVKLTPGGSIGPKYVLQLL